MSELNQSIAANLRLFLMEFKDEVIKGLQEYLLLNPNFSLESI